MIADMTRITIFGMLHQRDALIKKLIRWGVVQIDDANTAFGDETDELFGDAVSKEISSIEGDISAVSTAIKHLDAVGHRKKGLFRQKTPLGAKELQKLLARKNEIMDTAHKINDFTSRLTKLKAEENRIENEKAAIVPWQNYDSEFDITQTKTTFIYLGTISKTFDIGSFKTETENAKCVCNIISTDSNFYYLSLIILKDHLSSAEEILKKYNFLKSDFSHYTFTPQKTLNDLNEKLSQIARETEDIRLNISNLVDMNDDLKYLFDLLSVERDKKTICKSLAKTKSTFIINGWVEARKGSPVKRMIEDKFISAVILKNPQPDEEFPVLLKNAKIVKPFEVITELYSLPKASRKIDPNAIMAPFYFVFFGLMLSDAMYGLILGLAGFFILRKYKPEGTAKKLIGLLSVCGVSTFFWGAMFGGWFGNLASAVTNGKFSIDPIWFDPLDDPMKLLIWSFGFGLIHIYTALLICAYAHIKDGDIKSAVFDVGFWLLVLIGLPMLGAPAFLPMIGVNLSDNTSSIFSKTGIALTIVGTAGLVLTQGRGEKNIFKKIFKGISSLYDITGYLSDVLSYSRLLALGLSTSVISMVVNTMGTLLGTDNIAGILLFVAVFILGHALNLSINVLGAYVHTGRLQYVEFFGKFYEGGGVAFKPFKENTKYIKTGETDEY